MALIRGFEVQGARLAAGIMEYCSPVLSRYAE